MEAFSINSKNIEQTIGILVTFISEMKLQKEKLLAKYDWFFCRHMCPFWTPVRMGISMGMPQLKNWKRWHLG